MATFNINLPALNGQVEAGIAVGVDPAIPDDLKLAVHIPATRHQAAMNAKSIALVLIHRSAAPQATKPFLLNAASAMFDLGMIRSFNNAPDGDWRVIQVVPADPVTDAERQAITNAVNPQAMRSAITLVMATKANWWMMNHHTGQGEIQGYAKKTLEALYPGMDVATMTTAAHQAGHWASTRYVLTAAGVEGIQPTDNAGPEAVAELAFSDDAKLRFGGMPAGSHRIAIANEAAKRLVKSKFIRFFPQPEDLAAIPPAVAAIQQRRAAYHVGAFYLTGNQRLDSQDTLANSVLGRLGTFIRRCYGQSTLARSPHLTEAKVQTYDDYSADFAADLGAIIASQAQIRRQALDAINIAIAQNPDAAIQGVRGAFGIQG